MLPISSTLNSTAVRLSLATLALLTAAGGAIAVPSPARADDTPTTTVTVAAPAPTTISIRALEPRIAPGRSVTVTGNLHVVGVADAAGRTVSLEARPQGETEFTPVGTVVAGPAGGLRLRVTPEATTRYRWSYAGATDALAQTSGIVRVRVADPEQRAQRLPATLSVRAVPRGDDATVRGTLRSGRFELRGRLVVLLAQPSGQAGWQYAGAHRTGRDGRVDFGVAPATSTAYRLQFLGTTVFRPARSGVVRLAAVAPRPSVSISAAPQLVDRGATTTVSGTVTSAGLPLGGAVVDLLARPTGSKAGFDAVASATTAADGTVALVTSPTRDTTYRLRVQQTATTSPTLSAAVRVQVRAATSLSIRQRTAPAGLVVSGTLRSQGRPLAGQSVALMAQVPGSTTWVQVATDRTARRGGVSFVQPPAPGTGYRLEFAGTPRLSASTSGVVVG